MDRPMAGGEEPLMKRVILFIPILGWLACSNPLSQDDKNVVKILINEREPVGKYTIFWNGTDSNNKFVPAGNYKARLVTQSYVFEIDMTALDGTAGKSNDSTRIPILLPQLETLLEFNHPEPFRIRDGTTIPYSISEDYTTVQLTIRKP
jgi:hypothetical protein